MTDTTQIETTPPSSSTDVDRDNESWEIAALWRRLWQWGKWAITAFIALAFVTVLGQGFLYYRLIAETHPLLGYAFLSLLLVTLGLLIVRPLIAYFQTPLVASPPDVILDAEQPDQQALLKRIKYDLKFLKALLRHPDLQSEHETIQSSFAQGKTLLARIQSSYSVSVELIQELERFEQDHISAQLAPLDEKVDKLIHAEAVGVGVATAVSMNGTVDAFIVLWRSANLIAKISRIYFGRPNLKGSLIIMRDVAAIVVVSRALEDVTDMTGDLIGAVLGRMGGIVAGPLLDGAVNAMMTLKLGYLTKRRCRAYEGWRRDQAMSISARVLENVRRESGSVLNELIKACGGLSGRAVSAAETVMTGSRNTWSTIQSWFGSKKAE